jgi:hypothetical protein
LNDFFQRYAPEIKPLAARQDCLGQAMRLGGGKNEFHRGWRLLKGFQQCVESVFSNLVHFIDNVNLERATRRLIANVFDDLPDLIDSAIGGAINFDYIDTISLDNFFALNAFVTRGWSRTPSAIQRFRENPSCGCFSDSANASEQVGVSYTACSYSIL